MLSEFEITGELSDDCTQITLTHGRMMARVLRGFKEKKLLIKLSIFRSKRSDRQNRYIWGVVVPCVQAWHKETQGEVLDKDEVYAWLRISLLGYKPVVKMVLGEEVIIMTGKKFSSMNTKEFAEAIDEIRSLMDERGCYIPEPNGENLTENFIDE